MTAIPSEMTPQPISRQPTGLLEGVPQDGPLDPPHQNDQDHPPTYVSSVQHPQGSGHKTMGERFHKLSSAAGRPLNTASHLVGAEGFWPSTVNKECAKAARILYSFTEFKTDPPAKKGGPLHPTGLTKKSVVKIPLNILRNCHGLAIFNTIRCGAWHGSISGGSGLVIARRPDGTWSPPSSFVVSTLGAGFMLGLDVYDCVCVLNTPGQVAAFMHPRLSLGGNIAVTLGPVGTGGAVNSSVSKAPRPAFSYMKSRGLFAGIQVDGTVFVARGDANAVFYGERGISVKRILTEDVAWPMGGLPLFEVLKMIDGRTDFNRVILEEIGAVPPPENDRAVPDNIHNNDYESGVLDEKEASSSWVEVDAPNETEQPRQQGREDDLYSTSAADEKERLAKSGY
jgi:lipid-binding SYLF domain-containing protein